MLDAHYHNTRGQRSQLSPRQGHRQWHLLEVAAYLKDRVLTEIEKELPVYPSHPPHSQCCGGKCAWIPGNYVSNAHTRNTVLLTSTPMMFALYVKTLPGFFGGKTNLNPLFHFPLAQQSTLLIYSFTIQQFVYYSALAAETEGCSEAALSTVINISQDDICTGLWFTAAD